MIEEEDQDDKTPDSPPYWEDWTFDAERKCFALEISPKVKTLVVPNTGNIEVTIKPKDNFNEVRDIIFIQVASFLYEIVEPTAKKGAITQVYGYFKKTDEIKIQIALRDSKDILTNFPYFHLHKAEGCLQVKHAFPFEEYVERITKKEDVFLENIFHYCNFPNDWFVDLIVQEETDFIKERKKTFQEIHDKKKKLKEVKRAMKRKEKEEKIKKKLEESKENRKRFYEIRRKEMEEREKEKKKEEKLNEEEKEKEIKEKEEKKDKKMEKEKSKKESKKEEKIPEKPKKSELKTVDKSSKSRETIPPKSENNTEKLLGITPADYAKKPIVKKKRQVVEKKKKKSNPCCTIL